MSQPRDILALPTAADLVQLARFGHVPFAPLFDAPFADALPDVIEREIAAQRIPLAIDRIVAGEPTEWIISLGRVSGTGT